MTCTEVTTQIMKDMKVGGNLSVDSGYLFDVRDNTDGERRFCFHKAILID